MSNIRKAKEEALKKLTQRISVKQKNKETFQEFFSPIKSPNRSPTSTPPIKNPFSSRKQLFRTPEKTLKIDELISLQNMENNQNNQAININPPTHVDPPAHIPIHVDPPTHVDPPVHIPTPIIPPINNSPINNENRDINQHANLEDLPPNIAALINKMIELQVNKNTNSNVLLLEKQIHKLQMFDGKPKNYKQFINNVDMIINSLSPFSNRDYTKLLNMVKNTKVTSDVYQKLEDKVIDTFDELEASLHAITFDRSTVDSIMNKFKNYKLKDGEQIENFALRLKNNEEQLIRAYVNENISAEMALIFAQKCIIKTFVKGLPNTMKSICALHIDANLPELVEILKRSNFLLNNESHKSSNDLNRFKNFSLAKRNYSNPNTGKNYYNRNFYNKNYNNHKNYSQNYPNYNQYNRDYPMQNSYNNPNHFQRYSQKFNRNYSGNKPSYGSYNRNVNFKTNERNGYFNRNNNINAGQQGPQTQVQPKTDVPTTSQKN
jgi:hypothetical protein